MASMAQAVRSRSAVATACNSDIKYAVPRSLTTSSSQSNRRAPFSTWSVSLKRPAFAARNVTSRRVVKVDALQAMGTRLLKAIPASAKGSVFVAGEPVTGYNIVGLSGRLCLGSLDMLEVQCVAQAKRFVAHTQTAKTISEQQ